ncbi:hypothetical protein ACVI1J_005165 [Bradyrhizobium diazoefficiens]
MPRRKATLPIGFTSLAPFHIPDEAWENIEAACGFVIPADIRSFIAAKTQTMCWLSEAWQSALAVGDTVSQIAGVKRATVDWLERIGGLPPAVGDMIIPVDDAEQADLVIKPFMKLLAASCDERLAELASLDAEDAVHPWDRWIAEISDRFRQHGLPTGARKDVDKNKTGPSPFVIFILELQKLIEPQYRRHNQSPEALADGIADARVGSSPREDGARPDSPRGTNGKPSPE